MPHFFGDIFSSNPVTGNLISVSGPGDFGALTVRVSPFGRPPSTVQPTPKPTDFAATSTVGKQGPISIVFERTVDFIEITAKNSSVDGNKMIAFDVDGNVLNETFFGKGTSFSLFGRRVTFGEFESQRRIEVPKIKRIELHPASAEGFIFWGDLRVRLEEEAVTTIPVEPSDPSRPERKTLEIPLQIRAIRRPDHKERTIQIAFEIKPPIPLFERDPDATDTVLVVRPLPIDIELAIDNITEAIISPLINSFFDDDRELKTVLNFGLDFQSVLVNWRRDPTDLENHGILVKLLEPLPIARDVKELVWISRELSPSWTDKLFVTFTEVPGIIFFLRPPNRSTNVTQLSGKEVSGVTLNDLLPSGSIQTSDATLTLDDPILRQFYNTEAAQGVELLIDYADYNNFVHFSSAENRLGVFREKLQQIEVLDRDLAFQTAAASQSLLSGTLTDVSGTAQFAAMTTLIEDRERLVRGFDGYERFLFFETGSFSGSLSGLSEDTSFIRDNVAWPKDVDGVVLAVTSSASLAYFDDQSALAVDYDLANQEALKNNVPLYLQNDADSAEYITFLNMVGHSFDAVKGYIDAMPDIYDRDPSPERGLSNDLIWNVAQSMGIDLPNQYSIKQLVDFTVGRAATTQETYRRAISETWKRFLHNQIFIAKSKGTQTGIQALLNTYGIVPEMLRIRESVTPSPVFTTGSYELFEELTNAVQFSSGSSILVPFTATSLFSPATIELRFATALGTGSFAETILMHASPLSWSVMLSPTGSEANSRGFLQVLDSTGSALATSTVDKFFTGDFYSIMLRQNDTGSVVDFFIKKFEDDVFDYEFSSSITTDFSESFKTANVVIGSSLIDTGSNDVRIDEFRLWNELTAEETFRDHVQFPGMYAGNTFESANESLIFRHSFGTPQDLDATASLPNDTPFISSGSVASILTASVASGFDAAATFPHQFVRFSRQTKRFTPNAGGSQFSSNKVTIAPSASFRADALTITGSSVIPVLSRDKSIVTTIVERADAIKPDNRLGMYFTLAETINDSVLRSIGNFDLNDLIGDPSQLYDDGNTYTALEDLNKFYVRNYAPVFDQNAFIRFVEDLMEGVFSQVKTLIPIQTKLLTGVVIEPTILERNRIRLNRPLELSGKGSRNETQARTILAQSGSYPDARNVEATVETVLTGSMSAIESTLEATIPQTDIPISGTLQLLEVKVAETTRSITALIDQLLGLVDTNEDVLSIAGSTLDYSASIDLDSSTDLAALLNILSGEVSATSSLVLEGTVPTSLAVIDADIVGTVTAVGVDFLVPVIESANDLTDRRNREFFIHVSGSVGLVGFQKQRIRENLINDRGDWFKGGIYEEHDVVILSGSQYRSLTTRVLASDGTPVIFVSQIQPSQDPTNWTPVSFRTIIVPRLFKAVVSGSSHIGTGSVALVPFDQPGGVFTGYSQNHYKFFRNTGTAYIRSRFKGVLQTIDTTTDGRSPIETLLSSDAQLFVKDGTPRQTTKDEAGPVLEVRPDEPNQ